MSHSWERQHRYNGDRWEKCSKCGASTILDWMPGWPPWRDYFDSKGNSLTGEPTCVKASPDGT